mmetsp:Transcript_29412/g.77756  ORF Transcript_29412/g.77756 Transcript_29412/m.77756 type:complete len:220 (+) Transcript_29412:811-1470(+)
MGRTERGVPSPASLLLEVKSDTNECVLDVLEEPSPETQDIHRSMSELLVVEKACALKKSVFALSAVCVRISKPYGKRCTSACPCCSKLKASDKPVRMMPPIGASLLRYSPGVRYHASKRPPLSEASDTKEWFALGPVLPRGRPFSPRIAPAKLPFSVSACNTTHRQRQNPCRSCTHRNPVPGTRVIKSRITFHSPACCADSMSSHRRVFTLMAPWMPTS